VDSGDYDPSLSRDLSSARVAFERPGTSSSSSSEPYPPRTSRQAISRTLWATESTRLRSSSSVAALRSNRPFLLGRSLRSARGGLRLCSAAWAGSGLALPGPGPGGSPLSGAPLGLGELLREIEPVRGDVISGRFLRSGEVGDELGLELLPGLIGGPAVGLRLVEQLSLPWRRSLFLTPGRHARRLARRAVHRHAAPLRFVRGEKGGERKRRKPEQVRREPIGHRQLHRGQQPSAQSEQLN
jgi:hypothetical protein